MDIQANPKQLFVVDNSREALCEYVADAIVYILDNPGNPDKLRKLYVQSMHWTEQSLLNEFFQQLNTLGVFEEVSTAPSILALRWFRQQSWKLHHIASFIANPKIIGESTDNLIIMDGLRFRVRSDDEYEKSVNAAKTRVMGTKCPTVVVCNLEDLSSHYKQSCTDGLQRIGVAVSVHTHPTVC